MNIFSFINKIKRLPIALTGEYKKNNIMSLAIKAIPTLYGEEARRFREMADETERKYDNHPKRELTSDPRYKMMRKILERSNINF